MAEHTQDGLTVVSKPTYESVVSSMEKDRKLDKSFAEKVGQKIQKENPFVVKPLEDILQFYGEGEFGDGVAFGISIAYELLRNQSANDKLEEDYR